MTRAQRCGILTAVGVLLAGFAPARPAIAQGLASVRRAVPQRPAAASPLWAAAARRANDAAIRVPGIAPSPLGDRIASSMAVAARLPLSVDVENLLKSQTASRADRRMMDHLMPGLNEACRVYRVSLEFAF